jgi:polygalacturonase
MGITKTNNRMIDGSVVNVMDYGAYNDGTNTAATTTAIMAAFAAAQANGSGSIVFPAGTYSITESPVLAVTVLLLIWVLLTPNLYLL